MLLDHVVRLVPVPAHVRIGDEESAVLEVGVDHPAPHEKGQPPNGNVVPSSGLMQSESG